VINVCETRDRFLCDLSATRERESETFRLKYACRSPALSAVDFDEHSFPGRLISDWSSCPSVNVEQCSS